MGIENLSALLGNETEDHHVVIVGRAGDHPGSNIYLTTPGSKKEAIHTAETLYRRDQNLSRNIALASRVVFSGGEEEGKIFINKLTKFMDDKMKEEVENEAT